MRAIAPPPIATDKNNLNYDALYDQLESFIIQQVQFLSNQEIPRQAANPVIITKLQESFELLKSNYHQIMNQMEIVEQEIDTSELLVKLRPIQVGMERLQSDLKVLDQLTQLQNKISDTINITKQVVTETQNLTEPQNIPIIEEKLEFLLDQCDICADEIDTLETKKVDISEISKVYSSLLKEVESFQEIVDDVIDKLQSTETTLPGHNN